MLVPGVAWRAQRKPRHRPLPAWQFPLFRGVLPYSIEVGNASLGKENRSGQFGLALAGLSSLAWWDQQRGWKLQRSRSLWENPKGLLLKGGPRMLTGKVLAEGLYKQPPMRGPLRLSELEYVDSSLAYNFRHIVLGKYSSHCPRSTSLPRGAFLDKQICQWYRRANCSRGGILC